MVEKFALGLVRTCAAPAWWPFMMYNDLMRLELYCKGLDSRKYGFDPDRDVF